MPTTGEIRAKIARLKALLMTVIDEPTCKAITDLINEAEHAIARIEANSEAGQEDKPS